MILKDFRHPGKRTRPLKRSTVNLAAVVCQVLEGLEPLRDRNRVLIDFEPCLPVPEVRADAALIERAVFNLMVNRIEFVPAGGMVLVQMRPLPETGEIECSVQATGKGIPETELDRTFEALEKIADRKGLGLAFCREVIEAHGGRIWAEKMEKSGSRFVFRLPLESAPERKG